MRRYANEKHNEEVEVEQRLSDALNGLIDLSNYLFAIDEDHPTLDEISCIISDLEMVNFSDAYADAKAEAGESWWDEA